MRRHRQTLLSFAADVAVGIADVAAVAVAHVLVPLVLLLLLLLYVAAAAVAVAAVVGWRPLSVCIFICGA